MLNKTRMQEAATSESKQPKVLIETLYCVVWKEDFLSFRKYL